MKIKVLVTGAGSLLGQGIIKSLRMADTHYEIVAVDPDPRSVGLYWADRGHLVPLARESNYLEILYQIIDRERPQVVLVGTDVELMALSTNKAEIDASFDTLVIVSPPDVIQTADDKWLTYQFLATHEFPVIQSALPDGIETLLRECDFPLIVKPRVGARSVGVHKVHDEQELAYALNAVGDPIIQKCISRSDHEYTSGLVIINDLVRAVVTMRRELKDGNTYRAYVEPDSVFNDHLTEVAEKLGGMGSLNLQFRSDDGIPKIFEINARFSGTTPLRAHAGFNEVDHIIRYYLWGDEIPAPRLRPVVILKHWDELVIDPGDLISSSPGHQMRTS